MVHFQTAMGPHAWRKEKMLSSPFFTLDPPRPPPVHPSPPASAPRREPAAALGGSSAAGHAARPITEHVASLRSFPSYLLSDGFITTKLLAALELKEPPDSQRQDCHAILYWIISLIVAFTFLKGSYHMRHYIMSE